MSDVLASSTAPHSFVPRERLHGWRRWQAQSLDTPAEPAAPVEEEHPVVAHEDTAALEAQRLAQAEQEARERGYRDGYAQGHADGHTAGHAEGYAQGHAEGFESGKSEGLQAAAEQVERLRQAVRTAAHDLVTLDNEICEALTDLALSIARQVVQTELETRPDIVVPLVRQVLRTAPVNGGYVNVYLNPADAGLVSAQIVGDIGSEKWRVVPDAAIERGGCRVVTSLGEVDATLQTRWQSVLDALRPAGTRSEP